MKRTTLFLFCFIIATVAFAQQDSSYSYIFNCDICGIFETVSFEPIDLETEVEISSEVLPDTCLSTLASFSSAILRKASKGSGGLISNKSFLNVYPNPAKSKTYLNIETTRDGLAEIEFNDVPGRRLLYFEKYLHQGMNIIEQPLEVLPSGNIIVKVRFNDTFFVKKLLVLKY